jgi:AcrR family transcriptional regulator
VSTCTKASDSRERLILAAGKLFGERGLQGATTREIAKEAGVNELTLFRHFHSKSNLLAAVLLHAAEDQSQMQVRMDAREEDIGGGLLKFARAFNQMLETHEGLIRTLIGEAHRDPKSARQVTDGAFTPWRRSLTEYFAAKQEAGEIRSTLKLAPVVDQFLGMLIGGMLRRTCPWAPQDYDAEDYLQTSVEIFTRGVISRSDSSNEDAPLTRRS